VVHADEIEQYMRRDSADFAAWLQGRDAWTRVQLQQAVWGASLVQQGEERYAGPEGFRQAVRDIDTQHAERLSALQSTVGGAAPLDKEAIERRTAELERNHNAALAVIAAIRPRGVFESGLRAEIEAFSRLVHAAIAIRFGLGGVLGGQPLERDTVMGAAREMAVTAPGWAARTHPGFFFTFVVIGGLIWSLLGGSVARMSALQATRDERISPIAAIRFTASRWPWFVITPLVMPLVVAILCALLFIFGLALMGVPHLRVVLSAVGGLLFFLALFLGLAVSLLLIGIAMSIGLLYPALAVEGTDGFDAVNRSVSYVTSRPWHLLFYNFVTTVYGAITYFFIGTVIFLTLFVTQHFVALGADLINGPANDTAFVGDGGNGASRDNAAVNRGFASILPPPKVGQLAYAADWATLSPSDRVAAVLTMVWVYLFVGILAAYAISFWFSSQTLIYLLLRRTADGAEFDDVHLPSDVRQQAAPAPSAAPPDKVEPGNAPAVSEAKKA